MQKSKDAAAVRIFPPAVPFVTILLGVGLDRIWPLRFGYAVKSSFHYWVGGLVILGAVLGLGLWSVRLVRSGGQSENPWKPTTEIVTRGPFQLSRNPMYLQMVVGCVGFAILLKNWWILLLTPLEGWVLQRFVILPEERYLKHKFGEIYLVYKRRVRRWI